MIALPPAVAPPPPFPLVVAQSSLPEFVAPGVLRADYRMTTNAGPLVVHVVAVDTQESSVRIRMLLAHDHLISRGETISSMAQRSGAVAGINADYFDIGQTNQPLNVVVNEGMLVRTPSKRAAIAVSDDGTIGMGSFTFSGRAVWNETTVPLTAVNEWPPQGGASLLTSAYGTLPAGGPDVVVATLAPLDTTAGAPGNYRVAAVGGWPGGPVNAPLLALGPAARRGAALPAVDDTVQIAYETQPAFGGFFAAVGGGPRLVAGGQPATDPNAPAPEERDVRFPVSGAAVDADGALLLFAVDGRSPAVSVGLTRPQFAALMRGFGATDGLAFDSGGSATLVARLLGDEFATVVNTPSDGRERPVADGLFVFSDAQRGANPHLIVRPSTFSALPGGSVTLAGAIVDDAGHKIRDALVGPVVADALPGPHTAVVRERAGLTAQVAYTTVARAATLQILPDRPNPEPGGAVGLGVAAFDAAGNVLALGNAAAWRATGGTLTGSGVNVTYRAGVADAAVTVSAGGISTTTIVRVGSHAVAVPGFAAASWRFASLPAGAPGAVAAAPSELSLAYDFTGPERAAYANATVDLPGDPLDFRLEVFGDGGGETLRGAFVNRYGERESITLAQRVAWRGWQGVLAALPERLNPPVKLTSLYVLPGLGGAAVHTAGSLRFRAPVVRVRGSS